MYREREKLFDADILQRVRLLTHTAPPAQVVSQTTGTRGKEEQDDDDDDDSDREPCSGCLDRSCNGECMEGL